MPLTREEMLEYRESLKAKWDLKNGLDYARMEGSKDATKAIASKLKEKNVPLETIAEVSGLSIEEIRRL